MDNTYEGRVEEVSILVVEANTKDFDAAVEEFGKDTFEFRLKGKAWKDFTNDVKKSVQLKKQRIRLDKKNKC